MTECGKPFRPAMRADIVKRIADDITSGALSPGERVGTIETVMKEWGVSRPTATRALQELARRGLTRSHNGVGTYVSDNPVDNVAPIHSPVTLADVLSSVQALRSDIEALRASL